MAKENHLNNEVYIHDLDSYAVGMHNCLTIPFDKLLAEGFNTRQTDVRPARSINTAFQLFAVIFQLQSLQQFGGVSASHLDWTMVPYVRLSFKKHFKDGMKYLSHIELADIPDDIPIDNEMYLQGSKQKCIYKFLLFILIILLSCIKIYKKKVIKWFKTKFLRISSTQMMSFSNTQTGCVIFLDLNFIRFMRFSSFSTAMPNLFREVSEQHSKKTLLSSYRKRVFIIL